MKTYALDTNACIAILDDRSAKVTVRLRRARAQRANIVVPSLVAFELWYGSAHSAKREYNERRLEKFFAGAFEVISFDADDARAAGVVRAELRAAGTPIGAYDILIAGQARRRGWILVTANHREFRRVKRLILEDWAA